MCSMYTVQCTLYTEVYICALHNTQCTVYTVQYTVYTVHCTVRNVDCVPCFLSDYVTFLEHCRAVGKKHEQARSMTLDDFRMTE